MRVLLFPASIVCCHSKHWQEKLNQQSHMGHYITSRESLETTEGSSRNHGKWITLCHLLVVPGCDEPVHVTTFLPPTFPPHLLPGAACKLIHTSRSTAEEKSVCVRGSVWRGPPGPRFGGTAYHLFLAIYFPTLKSSPFTERVLPNKKLCKKN